MMRMMFGRTMKYTLGLVVKIDAAAGLWPGVLPATGH